jgi:hypothetical protein
LFVSTIAALSLTDRFAYFIEGLRKDVAAEGPRGRVAVPLIVLVWGRLRRMVARFASVVARFRDGTLPEAGSGRRRPARARPASLPCPADLPRRVAWVLQVIPGAACWRAGIEEMLDDPEMAAIVAGAPQIGRVLRPLCRMLGIEPVPALVLPRRRALNRPPPSPGPEDPSGPARRRAKLAARACFVWAPAANGAVRGCFGGRLRRPGSSTRKFGFEWARRWCVRYVTI